MLYIVTKPYTIFELLVYGDSEFMMNIQLECKCFHFQQDRAKSPRTDWVRSVGHQLRCFYIVSEF